MFVVPFKLEIDLEKALRAAMKAVLRRALLLFGLRHYFETSKRCTVMYRVLRQSQFQSKFSGFFINLNLLII